MEVREGWHPRGSLDVWAMAQHLYLALSTLVGYGDFQESDKI